MTGARPGGALFSVLILSTILLILGIMLPQLLVGTSAAMRNDHDRERVLYAAESGVAFAEARIKRQIGDDLLAGASPASQVFELTPSPDSPDFGHGSDLSYLVKLLNLTVPSLQLDQATQALRCAYQLDARAWTKAGRQVHLEVDGVLDVPLTIDRGSAGGIPAFSLGTIETHAIQRELAP